MLILLDSMEKVKNFVNIVSGFASDIDIESGKYQVDAKSILGIISLNLSKPMSLIVRDKTEEAAVRKSVSEYLF